MNECPFIDRSSELDLRYNKPIAFEGYKYYMHSDGFGVEYPVQFCKLCGRKRDPFQCMNESEWKFCNLYPQEPPDKADAVLKGEK